VNLPDGWDASRYVLHCYRLLGSRHFFRSPVGRHSRPQGGQAVVEFALVFSILMLIVCGIYDFGLAIAANSSLAHAAREGARAGLYGAFPGHDPDAAITAAVRQQAGVLVASADDIQIAITRSNAGTSDEKVTVRLTYDYHAMTPLIAPLLPDGKIRLVASAASVVYSYG